MTNLTRINLYELKEGDEILMLHNWLIQYMKVVKIPKDRKQHIKVSVGGNRKNYPYVFEQDTSKHTIQKWVRFNGNVILIKRESC